MSEETITYLNQGQSYEIKLKKVGELSNFRGKILKVRNIINIKSIFNQSPNMMEFPSNLMKKKEKKTFLTIQFCCCCCCFRD